MHVRAPAIPLDAGPLLWSKVPEFSMTYNGASAVIPYVEYFLNAVMNKVRADFCANNPALKEELTVFIRQETNHSQYHHRFNKRLFEMIPELKPVADKMAADLKLLMSKRSLAFNVSYCVGFESIATFDSKYLFEECDDLFEGAHPGGADLLRWHVAEEFEHRATCFKAYCEVSGNYFLRLHASLYAFFHIGGAFKRAESIVLEHCTKDMPESERTESHRRSKQLFRRHLRYLVPRMLRVFLPGYNPASVKVTPKIQKALDDFRLSGAGAS
jgi:predicted metal-dependent hydrolase